MADSYDDWLENVISCQEPLELSNEVVVKYATKLFLDSDGYLNQFSDKNSIDGLKNLISLSGSGYLFSAMDKRVPMQIRVKFINSILVFFNDYFSVKCKNYLSHKRTDQIQDINSICFMWWDIIPLYATKEKDSVVFEKSILDVMKRSLKIDSIACKESALHGLGHWELDYPREVSEIIAEFIENSKKLDVELLTYAKHAKDGLIV